MGVQVKAKSARAIKNLETKNDMLEIFYMEEVGKDKRALRSKDHHLFLAQIEHNRKMLLCLQRKKNGEKVIYPSPDFAL